MAMDNTLIIDVGFEPDDLLGKRFHYEARTFELVSILGAGQEGIVYEARDLETGESKKALKVYRRRLSEEEVQNRRAAYNKLREIGVSIVETDFVRIGDWSVELMEKLEGIFIHSSVDKAAEKQTRDGGRINGIIDLCNRGDFAAALQECDQALEEFPLNTMYLRLKGIALFGLNDGATADEVLNLCFEVEPNNTDHYVAVIHACAALGWIAVGRQWAERAARHAEDRKRAYRAWFDLEELGERLGMARHCIEQLRRLAEPESELQTLQVRLEQLDARLERCRCELGRAWQLRRDGRVGDAECIAHGLKEEFPYHAPALALLGLIAFEQGRYAEAIPDLQNAFWLRPMDNPDVTYLLGYCYLRTGNARIAAGVHSLWQRNFNEAADELQGGASNGTAGDRAGTEPRFNSEWEQRLVEDGALTTQQGLGILAAYEELAGDNPEELDQITEVTQGIERLLGWLDRCRALSPGQQARS